MFEVQRHWVSHVMPCWGRLRMAAKDDATGINPIDWVEVQRCVQEMRDVLEELELLMDDAGE